MNFFQMAREFLDRPESARGQLSQELIEELNLKSEPRFHAEKKKFLAELEARVLASIKNYGVPGQNSVEMKGYAGRKCIFHPQHTLTLSHTSQHYPQSQGRWACDGRKFPQAFKCPDPHTGPKDPSFNFYCQACNIDLCGVCAVTTIYPPEGAHELQRFHMNIVECLLAKSESASIRSAFQNGYQLLRDIPSVLQDKSSTKTEEIVSKLSKAARFMTSADQLVQQALRYVQQANRDLTAKCDQMETEYKKKKREAAEAVKASEQAIISIVFDSTALKQLDQALAEDREKLRRLEQQRDREASGVLGVFNFLGQKMAEAARVRGNLLEQIASLKFSIKSLERERSMFKPYASQANPVAWAAKEQEAKAKLDACHAIAARQRMELFMKFCCSLSGQLAKDCKLMAQLANAVEEAKKAGQAAASSSSSLHRSLEPVLQRLAVMADVSSGLLLTEADARSLSLSAGQLQQQLQAAVGAVEKEATEVTEIF